MSFFTKILIIRANDSSSFYLSIRANEYSVTEYLVQQNDWDIALLEFDRARDRWDGSDDFKLRYTAGSPTVRLQFKVSPTKVDHFRVPFSHFQTARAEVANLFK